MTIKELSEIVNNWYKEDEKNRSVFMVVANGNDVLSHFDDMKDVLLEDLEYMFSENDNFYSSFTSYDGRDTLAIATKMSDELRKVVINLLFSVVRIECGMYKQNDDE